MSMPRAVRHINEVRVLDALYRQGALTRADLARHLGLMRSTVGHLVAGMIEQGLVVEAPWEEAVSPPSASRLGRPGQLVRLNDQRSAFLGLDLGVGHLSVAAVDLAGRAFFSRTLALHLPFGELDGLLDRAVELVELALEELGPDRQVQGLTVVVPGLVGEEGCVRRAPLLGWRDIPLQSLLTQRLTWTLPFALENDANAFAAAEMYRRDHPSPGDGLFVYLDAGVGGGLASGGRLLRGHRGQAGEIGHIPLGERGFEPRTAVQGAFESYVGREAVLARFEQLGGAGEIAVAGQTWANAPDRWTTFEQALAAQTPAALRTLADWAWWMGRGLAALISVLDPSRIVLGGPVAALYRACAPAVADALARHLVQPAQLPPIEVSAQGAEVCALGGAMLLHRAHLSIDERLVYGGVTSPL